MQLELFDGLAAVPPFCEDVDTDPAVAYLRDRIAAADALLIATPEYNASIPGVLKNALCNVAAVNERVGHRDRAPALPAA